MKWCLGEKIESVAIFFTLLFPDCDNYFFQSRRVICVKQIQWNPALRNGHFSVSPVTNSDTSSTPLYGQYQRKQQ